MRIFFNTTRLYFTTHWTIASATCTHLNAFLCWIALINHLSVNWILKISDFFFCESYGMIFMWYYMVIHVVLYGYTCMVHTQYWTFCLSIHPGQQLKHVLHIQQLPIKLQPKATFQHAHFIKPYTANKLVNRGATPSISL